MASTLARPSMHFPRSLHSDRSGHFVCSAHPHRQDPLLIRFHLNDGQREILHFKESGECFIIIVRKYKQIHKHFHLVVIAPQDCILFLFSIAHKNWFII